MLYNFNKDKLIFINKGWIEMSVSKNITFLRKQFGYSQDEIATKLGVTRQTYSKLEKGTIDISIMQAQQLANIYGIKISDLFNEIQNIEKFKEMLIYILSKFEKRGLTKTKLAKLLYLSDFYYYYTHFKSISNVSYKCKEYGPLAEPFLETIEDMFEGGELHLEVSEEGAQLLTLSKSIKNIGIKKLSDEEKTKIDDVCNKWKNASTKELVNFTHKQKPWMACRENEIIPYDLILQEDPNNVF